MALVVLGVASAPAISRAAAGHASAVAIKIRPAAGSSHTRFTVTFTAPQKTGRIGDVERRYELSASTSGAAGCDSSPEAVAPASRKGRVLHVALVPNGSGWCAGTYSGKVEETQKAVCSAGHACPQYVLVLRQIGTFRFKVG